MKTQSRGVKKFHITLHPLFLVFGVFTAITGTFFSFLTATVSALEHECAHAFSARKRGYSLNRVSLMPYGAVISGDISGISPAQEIAVCLAGPVCSGLTALLFVALWWLFPETYPYTDTVAYMTFSLFLVNLLPAFPLDGGRILRALLRPLGERKAKKICLCVTFVCVAFLVGMFVFTCFSTPNFTLVFFALFLFFGCFGKDCYSRISFSRKKSFLRGVEEKRIALSSSRSVGYAVRFLREDKYLTLLLFDGEEFLGELSEEEFLSAVERGDWGQSLGNFLNESA